MACEPEKVSMDIDSPEESKQSADRPDGNGFHLYPVSVHDSGEGLPYAPEDWPSPGDKWRWKVGRRIAASGYFLDRYMYVPTRLRQPGQRKGFASRLSLEHYVRAKFPNADIDAFFASFSWKIPSKLLKKDNEEIFIPLARPAEDLVSGDLIGGVCCKAGNRLCSSLAAEEEPVSEVMFCDLCCSEPGFCRDCCCILCCRSIDKASEGYSYIICEANIGGSSCGHSCHIDCALRAYLAGTVGGSIGLDAEYYCRRCDSRTDLVSHVGKLINNYEANVSRGDIEKVLNIGIRALRGSKRTNAKQLLHHIQVAMSKLKNGTYVEDIWKKEDVSADTAGLSPNANGASEDIQDYRSVTLPTSSSSFDHRVESLKLDNEIDRILDELRKSQKIEYRLAEERLSAQRHYILNLYGQLDRERCDLSRHVPSNNQDLLLDAVLTRVDQIKREVSRLKDMGEVANGFGRVPKRILEDHFGLDVER